MRWLRVALLCAAMLVPKSPLVVLNFNFQIIPTPALAGELY